jgi:urease accessory protein
MSAAGRLLAALQLADSAFPIGGFALSHGLESAVELGVARELADVEAYLATLLRAQLATLDLAAVAAAHRSRSDEAAAGLDRALLARKLAREPREAARRAGRALLVAAPALGADLGGYARLVAAGAAPGLHPIVHGLASRAVGLAAVDACLTFAHGFALGGLVAAVRLLPIGHLDQQATLLRLRPAIEAAAATALATAPEEWRTFAPQAELLAMRHERGLARSFAT